MKKLLSTIVMAFLVMSITSVTFAQGGNSYSELFAGYQGPMRAQVNIPGTPDVIYMNSNFVNAGSASSAFIFKGNPCLKTQTPITWVDCITTSLLNCPFGFIANQSPIMMHGSFKHSVNNGYFLFADFNGTYSTASPRLEFFFSGPNNAGARVSLATTISTSPWIIRVVVTAGVDINFVPVDQIADLNMNTGVVTSRGDLRPYLSASGGLTGVAETKTIRRMGNGKILHWIYGDRIGSTTGVVAEKGFIEDLSNGQITNLALDNINGTYAIGWEECGGEGYFTYSNSSPVAPLTSGLSKRNLTTGAYGGCGTGIGTGGTGLIVVNGKVAFWGFPKTSNPSVFAVYDPASNLITNLSSGLFINQATSSVVLTVVPIINCSGCADGYSVGGNFNNSVASNSTQYSLYTHLARSCMTGPLAIHLLDFGAEKKINGILLDWNIADQEIGGYFELERSTDGVNFHLINAQQCGLQKGFAYLDRTVTSGKYLYRLKMVNADGKYFYSNVVVLNFDTKDLGVLIYPNPVQKGSNAQIAVSGGTLKSYVVINNMGQVVSKKDNMTVTGNATLPLEHLSPGFYMIQMTMADASAKTQKIIIQ